MDVWTDGEHNIIGPVKVLFLCTLSDTSLFLSKFHENI